MELRQLRTFVAVADHGGFTRAAELLNLTQPAVTRQIAALEAETQTRLLERLGRRVQLTVAGEALHAYAVRIVHLVDEAERAVSDVARGAIGRLAVGASSTTATYVLPPLLRRFRETHRGVELSVHTGVSAQVGEMVVANQVDVGVVTGFKSVAGLVELPLADYATGVVVYPDHPLASVESGAGVRTAELAGHPLILMEEGTNLRTYVDRLSEAGVAEQISMEMDNVEAIKKMIEAKLGISLLPMISVQTEVASGRLIALPLADFPSGSRRISAIYRRDKYLSAALRAFLDLLRSELGAH